MAEIKWDFSDPLMEKMSLTQEEQGLWIVRLSVRELHAGSLGQKVIRAKLVDQGRFLGKEIGVETWPVGQTRPQGGVSGTTLVFNTGTKEYPDKTRIEFEFVEEK